MSMKSKEQPIEEILEKPHAERTLEERVRCCEHVIKLLCDYNERNKAAISAAWMNVPMG